jgi:hypothetical protein
MYKKFESEIQLCETVVNHFSDGEVYKEVPTANGRCDIVVVHGSIYTLIEAKLQFNTTVIYQAYQNFRYSNYSYIAIPKTINNRAYYAGVNICKQLGIGILLCEPGRVDFSHKPSFRRKVLSPKLLDTMKLATAGAQHNDMSEFKVTLITIERILKNNGGALSIDNMFNLNSFHYSSPMHAKRQICRLISTGVIKSIVIENKKLILTPLTPLPV